MRCSTDVPLHLFTRLTKKAGRARTGVAIDLILAHTTILAGFRLALVNIYGAVLSCRVKSVTVRRHKKV